jgi:hypothetical protein
MELYLNLMGPGKKQRKTVTAIGRELLALFWAICIKAEAARKQQLAA